MPRAMRFWRAKNRQNNSAARGEDSRGAMCLSDGGRTSDKVFARWWEDPLAKLFQPKA